jgi:hypothetical protein
VEKYYERGADCLLLTNERIPLLEAAGLVAALLLRAALECMALTVILISISALSINLSLI